MSPNCCTICASPLDRGRSKTGSLGTKQTQQIWERLIPIFLDGGELRPTNLATVYPSPICCCATCQKLLNELDTLRGELVKMVESIRSLVAKSGTSGHFQPAISSLRAQLIAGTRYGTSDGGTSHFQQQCGYNAGNTLQSVKSLSPNRRSQRLEKRNPYPSFFAPPQESINAPCEQRVELDEGEFFTLESAEPRNCPVDNESNWASGDNEDGQDISDSSSANSPSSSPLPPPPKRHKKGPRPGKMPTAQRLSMLEKRSLVAAEEFAPIVKTNDGRVFYESHEIITLPSGNMQCATCGWKETNNHEVRQSVKQRTVKIHIKGMHLNSYKCILCNESKSCLKSLKIHEKTCGKRTRHTPRYKCDGCDKLFTFAQNMRKHKIAFKCGSQNLPPSKLAINPHIKTHLKAMCSICGRYVHEGYLKEHEFTHKNKEEKAAAIALGNYPDRLKSSMCPYCAKMISKPYFALHLNFHKKGDEQKTVSCQVEGCGRVFLNRIILRAHVRNVHEKKKSEIQFTCGEPYCHKRKFKTRKLLFAHRRRIHFRENLILRCPLCNLPRSTQYELNVHSKMHRDNNHTAEMFALGCSHCSTKFMSEFTLNNHIKRVHPEVKIVKKKYVMPAKKRQKITPVTDDKTGKHIPRKTKGRNRKIQQQKVRADLPKPQRIPCSICSQPLFPREDSNHRWNHYGLQELIDAVNSRDKLPSVFLKSKFGILAHLKQDDIAINCRICENTSSTTTSFPTVASLHDHIATNHINTENQTVEIGSKERSTSPPTRKECIRSKKKINPKNADDASQKSKHLHKPSSLLKPVTILPKIIQPIATAATNQPQGIQFVIVGGQVVGTIAGNGTFVPVIVSTSIPGNANASPVVKHNDKSVPEPYTLKSDAGKK